MHFLFIVQRFGGVGILNDLNLLDDGPCCWVESLEERAKNTDITRQWKSLVMSFGVLLRIMILYSMSLRLCM